MAAGPRLLRETAEIALTEIKRFMEPRLMEVFNLRRVSAPLFLPVGSPFSDPRHPGTEVALPGSGRSIEIVGSLDLWLRGQLTRYDIAPGFGVFTIMNALRPELPVNSLSSPHVVTWAWQQAREENAPARKLMVSTANRIYSIFLETEKMILGLFPHLTPMLARQMVKIQHSELEERYPDMTPARRIYQALHPERGVVSHKEPAALLLLHGDAEISELAEIWVWNPLAGRPLQLAEIAFWRDAEIAGPSVGGNIFRDMLAVHLLHQSERLSE